MKFKVLCKVAFISVGLFMALFAKDIASAGVIRGTVTDKNGKGLSKAAVLLYNVVEQKEKPILKISTEDGRFEFEVPDHPQAFRIIAYSDGKTAEKTLPYPGTSIETEIQVGDKWHDRKWAKALWTFASMFISFLIGLFSRDVTDRLRKRKVQTDIAKMYEKSVNDFLEEYERIKVTHQLDETNYSAFYRGFLRLKDNVRSLSSYSWAAEKVDPGFFSKIQRKLSYIQEMETLYPFDKGRGYESKLEFLKKHDNEKNWPPYAKEHQDFADSLQKLGRPLNREGQ